MIEKVKKYGVLTIALLLVVIAAFLATNSIQLKAMTVGDVTKILSSLLFLALVTERALEVFLSTWRDPGAAALKGTLAAHKAAHRIAAEPQKTALQITIDSDSVAVAAYSARTKQIALQFGFLLGVLISLAGIRVLSELVAPESLAAAPAPQRSFFHCVDVFVSGGLIAGGSDGIHQIMAVYSDFMTQTRARLAGP
jgi:hypothetical protein